MILAILVGADLTFVVAHHLLRIFFVILGAPIIASLLPLRYKDEIVLPKSNYFTYALSHPRLI